jgi:alpha-L-arabinofuranosidase
MRAVDPSTKLLSSFGTPQTLARTGNRLDYLCPHQYSIEDLAATDAQLSALAGQIKHDAPGRDVRLAITEWNATGGDWGLARGKLQTLANALACSRYQNLLHRRADLVEMAMRSNLIDSFGSGFIVTGPGWMYLSPAYYSQKLYQSAAGSYPVRIERGSAAGDGRVPGGSPDVSAVISPDGRTLCIFAVNDEASFHRVALRFDGFSPAAPIAGAVVLRDHLEPLSAEAMNSRDDPRRISIDDARSLAASQGVFQITFEPFTLTRIEMRW